MQHGGAEFCIYKRYLGYADGHELWLWKCDPEHKSLKYQFEFDETSGLIKSLGSVKKDAENPYCWHVGELDRVWTQRVKIKQCDASDSGQKFTFTSEGGRLQRLS